MECISGRILTQAASLCVMIFSASADAMSEFGAVL
jgi:hypothetical protein